MESISKRESCIKNQLIGLRVVRNPDCWAWGTQDGGEGSVGTVVGIVGNTQNPRNVKVRWDSGEEFVYRIGAEDAYDLRVLDNSTIGVKHPGVTCQGCFQENIVGFRWQCSDCSEPNNLCTFCFTNGKHNLSHVNFKRYDQPSSDPISVRFDSDEQKIQLKGIFPGALVGRGINWSYHKEDGGFPSVGKVVPSPNGQHGGTPGKVWVQWPHKKDKSYSYRVGFNGKMDLEMVSAGVCGRYQPHTLPILKISKPKLDEKAKDVDVALPLVVGDTVRVTVGSEELRDQIVDCGLKWIPSKMGKVTKMKTMVNEVGEVKYVHKNFVAVEFPNIGTFCIPEKALKRLIPWLPVDSVVQVSNRPDMVGNFGCVKKVNSDGTTVEMEFLESGENKTISVSQLKKEIVDTSLVKMGELMRENKGTEALSVHLLVLEVDKGAALSVEYLLQNFPNIVDCRSSYNGTNCTALSVACQKGNLEMVKLLLQCKASVDSKDENNSKERCNGPIHHAVLGNHPEILKRLLENGASPNDKDFYENTPLHLAAAYGYVECLKLLLEDQRCDLSLTHDWGKTAFTLAVESPVQSLEMFNLFYTTNKLKLNLTDEEYRKILPLAAKNNHFEAVKTILSSPEGKNLAKILYHNETPLYMACESAHNQIAKLLVSHVGKDEQGKPWAIDTKEGWRGKTPLMRVTKDCNYELIEFLVEAGANLLATDETGDTPFHYAVRLFRKKEKYLIKHPNEATAPQISKLYNQLKTKRPDGNLCPSAAIVYYLFSKGRMSTNLKLPDIKKHIDDNFLYEEIIKICPDFNSMALILKDQRNSLEGSHQPSVLDEFSGLETGSTNLKITDPTLSERIRSWPIKQQQNTFPLLSPPTVHGHDRNSLLPSYNREHSQSGMPINDSLNTEKSRWSPALSPSLVFPASWSPAPLNSVVSDDMNEATLGGHNSLLPLEYNREQSQFGTAISDDSLNTEQLGWPPAWSPSAIINPLGNTIMDDPNWGEVYLNTMTTITVERAAATNETTAVNSENNWSGAETNRKSSMSDETINSQQSRTNHQLTAGAHFITPNLNSQQCSPNLQIQLNVADKLNSESHGDIPEKTQECVSDTVENGNQLHQSNHTTTMQQQTIFPSSSEESIPNVSTTADISTVDPVTIRTSEPEKELTCTIDQNPKQGKFFWIIIDEEGRRYSQQKKNVSDIFQCTANVSEKNKKCKGTINVENLEGKLEEWKTDNKKTFTFTVRNAHEIHIRKRSSRSTETGTSSPSNKKTKK